MALDLHGLETGRPVAVVGHGLSGAPGQPHMLPVVAACRAAGLGVMAPHFRNSGANASDGTTRDFTMAGAVADLAEALDWLQAEGFGAPALVAGHSMGGFAALRLAAEREEIAAVLAISPVTAGRLLIAAHEAEGTLDMLAGEVPQAIDEWPTHDLAPLGPRIAQPVALMVGERDHLTQVAHVLMLRERLANVVFWQVLEGEPHCPVGPDYPRALSAALQQLGFGGRRGA